MKKMGGFVFLMIVLAGCAVIAGENGASTTNPHLPDLGQAPELTNEIWINTEQPLRLENLRGQVVLLDMWTFG